MKLIPRNKIVTRDKRSGEAEHCSIVPASRNLGQHLRQTKLSKGLNAKSAAWNVGITPECLYCIERGDHFGSAKTIRILASVLGLPPESLIEPMVQIHREKIERVLNESIEVPCEE